MNESQNQDNAIPSAKIEASELAPTQPPDKPKQSRKKILVIVFVLLLNLSTLAGSSFFFIKKPESIIVGTTADSAAKQQDVAPIDGYEKSKNKPITSKKYSSESFKLSFSYPSDWRIETTPDDSKMTLSSAPFDVIDDSGLKKQVSFRVQITNKYVNNDVVDDVSKAEGYSEAMDYSNPSPVQRKTTNLTYIASGATENPEFEGPTNGFFVSGNLIYEENQSIKQQGYKKINPFVVAFMVPCQQSVCDGAPVDTINQGSFNGTYQVSVAKKIITSMRFTE